MGTATPQGEHRVPEPLQTALGTQYVIERELGRGGMATVYLARDLRHDRVVAIKVLKPELAAVIGSQRFILEIKTTARLQHPHILPLFDSGEAGVLLYYVMPYLEGETVRDKLNRETQFGVDEAVRIAREVADALDYAHRHGVVHRDIKPENILLHDGRALVMDFGIALAVSAAAGGRLTETGLSLGTPHYMSPEQATADREISARSDVYSLGAVLYEMLTGDPPHTGSSAQQIIMKIIAEPVEPVTKYRRSVPPNVAAVLDIALEKLPADRFENARAFADALANPAFTRSVTSEVVGAPGATRDRSRYRSAVLALLATVGYAGWVWSARTHPNVTLQRPIELDLTLPESVTTSAAGGVAMLALSRDGNNLLFQGAQPGSEPALYLRRFADRTVERIAGTAGAQRPVLSPEGSEVLFSVSSPTPAIVRVSIRGGVPKTLVAGNPLGISASDAGEVLCSVDGRLVVIGREGGSPRLLAVPDSARGHLAYEWPDVLPGSRSALVAIRTNRAYVLGIVRLRDGKVTELGVAGLFPRYSASGHLFYVTADGRLFAAPFSAGSARVTGLAVLVAEGVRVGSGGGAAYSVSDNGTLAYVEARGGRRALAIATRTGQVHVLPAPPRSYKLPAVAPDGRRVGLTLSALDARERDVPVQPDIWIYDTATAALTRLTTDSASSKPVWTADGQRVAFVRSGDSVVWSLPVSGNAPAVALLKSNFAISDFALGPRHGYSALVPAVPVGGAHDVWVAPNDSLGVARPFLDGRYDEAVPVVSPDGRWIAYESRKTGRSEVYARPLVGDGAEIPVSINGGQEPRWKSDGTELFYRSLGVSAYLMSARVAASPALEVVRRDTLFRFAARTYDPFPGGRAFLLVQDAANVRGEGPITIVLNWRPAAVTPSP